MINWVIINNEERGSNYGIGTFIKNMISGLIKTQSVVPILVFVSRYRTDEFSIKEDNGLIVIRIPGSDSKGGNFNILNTPSNSAKYSARVVDLLYPALENLQNIVIHINYLYHFHIASELKKRLECKIIYTQHYSINKYNLDSLNNPSDIGNNLYSLCDKIITVSGYEYNCLIDKISIDKRKISLIENGLEIDDFKIKINKKDVLERYGISEYDKIVVFSGRLEEIKGLRYLLDAFRIVASKVRESRLIIAGDGDFWEYIGLCNGINARITFLGYQKYSSLIEIYAISNVGVIPSLEEPFGYSALEMIASGLPMVVSQVGGLIDLMKYSHNFYIVPMIKDSLNKYGHRPDIYYMANAILNILSSSQGRTTKKKNIKRFSNLFMAEKYIRLLNSEG